MQVQWFSSTDSSWSCTRHPASMRRPDAELNPWAQEETVDSAIAKRFFPLESVSNPWRDSFKACALNYNVIELSQPQSFKLDVTMPNLTPTKRPSVR